MGGRLTTALPEEGKMPLYDYECEGGHRFEEIRSIEDRNNAVCPDCKKPVHIRISSVGKPVIAHTFTTVGHDGSVMGQRQTTERTEYPIRKKSGKVVNA